MYIFLCPKTFSLANSAGSLEGKFLKYYLGRKGIKAKLSNELWEAFCFRLMDKSGINKMLKNLLRNKEDILSLKMKSGIMKPMKKLMRKGIIIMANW